MRKTMYWKVLKSKELSEVVKDEQHVKRQALGIERIASRTNIGINRLHCKLSSEQKQKSVETPEEIVVIHVFNRAHASARRAAQRTGRARGRRTGRQNTETDCRRRAEGECERVEACGNVS